MTTHSATSRWPLPSSSSCCWPGVISLALHKAAAGCRRPFSKGHTRPSWMPSKVSNCLTKSQAGCTSSATAEKGKCQLGTAETAKWSFHSLTGPPQPFSHLPASLWVAANSQLPNSIPSDFAYWKPQLVRRSLLNNLQFSLKQRQWKLLPLLHNVVMWCSLSWQHHLETKSPIPVINGIKSCWEIKEQRDGYTTPIPAPPQAIHKHEQNCLCIKPQSESQSKWVQIICFLQALWS